MTLLEQLLADHEEFRRLGRAIEAILRSPDGAQNAAQVEALVKEFQAKMRRHAHLEDDTLYPAMRRNMGRSSFLDDLYLRHLDSEHHNIEEQLAKLHEQVSGRLALGWGQTFAIFSVGLKSHMRREEDELFPEAERLLGNGLSSAGT
ncbi:MAG: hemerythrin domain-containing protein [Elusimicrobia bacterium]|nr:hemerythrin domain-containing protein [Elusimicrobiota bacterium]